MKGPHVELMVYCTTCAYVRLMLFYSVEQKELLNGDKRSLYCWVCEGERMFKLVKGSV